MCATLQLNNLQQKHVEEEVSVVSNQLEEDEDDEQRGLIVDYDEEDLLNLQVFHSIMRCIVIIMICKICDFFTILYTVVYTTKHGRFDCGTNFTLPFYYLVNTIFFLVFFSLNPISL